MSMLQPTPEQTEGRITRPVLRAVMAIVMMVVAMLAIATPAQAATTIGSCRGAMWGLLSQEICVTADMGGKDHYTKYQFVHWVEAKADAPARKLEIWGDGFYHSGSGSSRYWSINRWLRSGTNVCAAATDWHNVRSIACFTVRV